ncbi:MAG: adenylyltransferase/cytidyltransferase family protein [Candidatus Harrisonbacteria bacterium]|nr:adenylyltransferase/cytidyltransferase family protein [Candidatus Harrisonbacteria bacterium]
MKASKKRRVGIFRPESNFKDRFIPDYKELADVVSHCKGLGLKIVLTQGTYDMVHIGHARYFEEAKKHGDILIVAVDSDEKVRRRKGPERPIVPQEERLEMVAHTRPVDVVTLKEDHYPKWHLIKLIRPDILIISETSGLYNRQKMAQLKKLCGKLVVLKPQATTSTSAKIRLMQINTAKKLKQTLTPKIMNLLEDLAGEKLTPKTSPKRK